MVYTLGAERDKQALKMADLNSLTVPQLKTLLTERGLSQKGRKSELISRLEEVETLI